MSVFLPARFFIVFLPVINLLLSGCAAFNQRESVDFDAVYDRTKFTPRQKAQTTTKTRKQLDRQGYVYIGDLDVEYVIAECEGKGNKNCRKVKQESTPTARILIAAASKGGDVVRFSKNNKEEATTRYENGKCLKTEMVRQTVLVPSYSYECRQVGNNQECGNVQRGSEFSTQMQPTCVRHEKVPYTVKILRSTGKVWRFDKPFAAETKLRIALENGTRQQVKRHLKNLKGMSRLMLLDPVYPNRGYPLKIALKHDNAEAIKAMLDLGLKPNRKVHYQIRYARENMTYPLLAAVDQEAEKSIAVLLKRGAKTNHPDILSKAIKDIRPDIVMLLIAHGARVNLSIDKKDAILDLAERASMSGYVRGREKTSYKKSGEIILKLLLSHGSNINSTDSKGRTALYIAAEKHDLFALKLLLKHGANKKIRAKNGHSPASIAMAKMYSQGKKKDYDAIIALLGKDSRLAPK